MPLKMGNTSGGAGKAGRTLRQMAWDVRGRLRENDWMGAWNAGVAGLANGFNRLLAAARRPRVLCSCCGYTGHAFVHLSNRLRIAWHSLCPACQSRSRHRGLTLLFRELAGVGGPSIGAILHFAPEPLLGEVLRETFSGAAYQTTDLLVPDVDFPGQDIQNLTLPSEKWDLVVCNHVLEHVPRDEQAVREMVRILRPEGVAVITVPGDWSRPKTVVLPDLSLNGHYRDYGADVVDLFRAAFASVEVVELSRLNSAPGGLWYGIRADDRAFVCRKAS